MGSRQNRPHWNVWGTVGSRVVMRDCQVVLNTGERCLKPVSRWTAANLGPACREHEDVYRCDSATLAAARDAAVRDFRARLDPGPLYDDDL